MNCVEVRESGSPEVRKSLVIGSAKSLGVIFQGNRNAGAISLINLFQLSNRGTKIIGLTNVIHHTRLPDFQTSGLPDPKRTSELPDFLMEYGAFP